MMPYGSKEKDMSARFLLTMAILYVVVILMCVLWYGSVRRSDGTMIMTRYDEMSKEEQSRYDINRIKSVQLVYIIAATIALLAFVTVAGFAHNGTANLVFALILLAFGILSYVIKNTTLLLNAFCHATER